MSFSRGMGVNNRTFNVGVLEVGLGAGRAGGETYWGLIPR